MSDERTGNLEHLVAHSMGCAIYGPPLLSYPRGSVYPHLSGKPCNCAVRIVRQVEAEKRTLKSDLFTAQARIAELENDGRVSEKEHSELKARIVELEEENADLRSQLKFTQQLSHEFESKLIAAKGDA